MRYPILIEEGSDTKAWGVVVPDLPGCFSAGDSLDEAVENAKQAAAAWIDTALDHGMPLPPPSSLDHIRKLDGYQGWPLMLLDLSDDLASDVIERVNITLPRRVLLRLDTLAKARNQTRGAFIAGLTRHLPDAEDPRSQK